MQNGVKFLIMCRSGLAIERELLHQPPLKLKIPFHKRLTEACCQKKLVDSLEM
jgi:hypothetical protein